MPISSFSLSFFSQPCTSFSPPLFHRNPLTGDQHTPHVEEAQPLTKASMKFRPEMSTGGALVGRRRSRLPSPFSPNFGVVRPYFLVKPPILEQAFDPLQVYTHLDKRILNVEKWITIHTVPFTDFFGEPGHFREVRHPKVWCTLHKLSFDIYIGYVLRMFRNHCLDLCARLIEGRNWKLIPPLDSFQCHKPSGRLGISKWTSVRKHIFWGKLVARFCVKIWFVDFRDSVLENKHTCGLLLISRI